MALDRKSNLRNAVLTTSSGKDVKNTQMLKGEAKPNAAFNEKNELKQHVTGTNVPGPFGGHPNRG